MHGVADKKKTFRIYYNVCMQMDAVLRSAPKKNCRKHFCHYLYVQLSAPQVNTIPIPQNGM